MHASKRLICRRWLSHMSGLILTFAFVVTYASAPAQTPLPSQAKNDYSKGENWLCRPGRADACAIDLTTTVVAADGTLTREEFHAAPAAPIDCFYVYPTVSAQPTPNADMAIEPEERGAIRMQFARFAAKCRPFAPLYRQMTIEQLRKAINGTGDAGDQNMAYRRCARCLEPLPAARRWRARRRAGREHSQGSGELTQVAAAGIRRQAMQKQLVSAILAGTPRGSEGTRRRRHVPGRYRYAGRPARWDASL